MQKRPDYSKIKLQRGRVSTPYEPIPVSAIIHKVAKKLKFDDNSEDYLIIKYWDQFLKDHGFESLIKYTYAHRISKDRKLVIGVKSAVIANELQFIKADLEKSFLLQSSTRFDKAIISLIFELRT